YENSGLLKPDIFHELKILPARTDPAGYFRKLISSLKTFINRVPVLFTVEEEFTLSDFPVWSSQAVQIIVNCYNLICCIRRSRLLPVAECGICNPYLIRHIMRHNPVIEGNLRYLVIVEQIPEHIRFLHIDKRVNMFLQFQKI